MKNRGEIAVFDAGKYFSGPESRGLRITDGDNAEDELDEEVMKLEDADGNLPLTPLSELYMSGKLRHFCAKQQDGRTQEDGAGREELGFSGAAVNRELRDSGTAGDKSRRMQKTSPRAAKLQAFSPSMRLTSFLAKFKLSSDSKACKPHASSSTATSTASHLPAVSGAGQVSAASALPKSYVPANASSVPPNSKASSPRGRFLLRALSSSSQSNALPKPINRMQHHGAVAASTPVSPAGSDPYSPITHSASTTPNSRRNPRSRRARSAHVPTSPAASIDWRSNVDNPSSRSLSAHLPFIRRKLRAYLMPEKSPRHHKESIYQQTDVGSKQEKMTLNQDHHHHHRHQLTNSGTGRNSQKQQRAGASGASRAFVAGVSRAEHPLAAATVPGQGSTVDRQQTGNPLRSPALIMKAATASMATRVDQTQPSRKLETWGRGEYWARRKAEAEELDDDIAVAERLLRVVKEHQSVLSSHQSYGAGSGYTATAQQVKGSHSRVQNGGGLVGEGGRLAGEGDKGNEGLGLVGGRKSRKSTISPFTGSSPARFSSGSSSISGMKKGVSNKEVEYACPYDSDSSSDLFEIETLQAFSHVAGLYRPRDLPVYDTKSPMRSTSKSQKPKSPK